jgi:hypothetical protein
VSDHSTPDEETAAREGAGGSALSNPRQLETVAAVHSSDHVHSSDRLETGLPGYVRRGSRYLRPFGGWLAGIMAAVVAAAITALLLTWDLLPGAEPRSVPTASQVTPPQVTASQPTASQEDVLPFTVAVRASSGLGEWVANQPLADLPARPGASGNDGDWADWARRTGAVPTTQSVSFTVQGRSEAQVVLTDLRVRVVERLPAIAGVLVRAGFGGDAVYRWVSADLDTDPPTLSPGIDEMYEGSAPAERRPIAFPYEVSISDAETFLVDGTADSCYCSWIIELSWASEGHVGTVTIDDNGKPFRVTGKSNITVSCETSGNGEKCRAP